MIATSEKSSTGKSRAAARHRFRIEMGHEARVTPPSLRQIRNEKRMQLTKHMTGCADFRRRSGVGNRSCRSTAGASAVHQRRQQLGKRHARHGRREADL